MIWLECFAWHAAGWPAATAIAYRAIACEYRKSIEFTERSVTGGFVSSAALGGGRPEERALERIYQLLLTAGYPVQGVDWLRRHRSATIIVLAIASWMLFIGIGWLVWSLLTGAA